MPPTAAVDQFVAKQTAIKPRDSRASERESFMSMNHSEEASLSGISRHAQPAFLVMHSQPEWRRHRDLNGSSLLASMTRLGGIASEQGRLCSATGKLARAQPGRGRGRNESRRYAAGGPPAARAARQPTPERGQADSDGVLGGGSWPGSLTSYSYSQSSRYSPGPGCRPPNLRAQRSTTLGQPGPVHP